MPLGRRLAIAPAAAEGGMLVVCEAANACRLRLIRLRLSWRLARVLFIGDFVFPTQFLNLEPGYSW